MISEVPYQYSIILQSD